MKYMRDTTILTEAIGEQSYCDINQEWILIDIALSWVKNIVKAELVHVQRIHELAGQNPWLVPSIISSCPFCGCWTQKYFQEWFYLVICLEMADIIGSTSVAVLLQTAQVLRKMLCLWVADKRWDMSIFTQPKHLSRNPSNLEDAWMVPDIIGSTPVAVLLKAAHLSRGQELRYHPLHLASTSLLPNL